MVNTRLYLPKDWCNNPTRCQEAGIPKDKRKFKTKLELAADIIDHQVSQGLSFNFVTADGYYGNDASFARLIDNRGFVYMLDIHANQAIYLERPDLLLPERKSTKGRCPQRLKATTKSTTVSRRLQSLNDKSWQLLTVKNTTKGLLKGEYHFAKVFIWDKSINAIESRLLVIRNTKSNKDAIDIKYSFTNANLEQYTPEVLAYMQAERFFVEHCIKESKQILGFDLFQTRVWNAWEHQIALNFI